GYQRGFGEVAAVWNGNLLFALIVVEAALVGLGAMVFIGRRARWGPVDKMPELAALSSVNAWWVAPLAIASLPLLFFTPGDSSRLLVRWSRASRASFTLIAALIAGAAQSFWFYPALAAQLSPKEVFDAYARLHKPGEPLALLGVRARAAAYYSGGEVTSF